VTWARNGALTDGVTVSRSLASLVQPRVGIIDQVANLWQEMGVPRYALVTAELDNVTMTFPYVRERDGSDVRDRIIGGAGSDLDPDVAWIKAVAEAAERYATLTFNDRDFIVAPASELGASAINLMEIPRCSPRELSDPRCLIRDPDMQAPIRWVRGFSLTHQCERLVPAVMTHLFLNPWATERFWIPISTGVAAHTDLAAAIGSAICEVIERDAIALTWLTRRPLARIAPLTQTDGPLAEVRRRIDEARSRYEIFDATTDLGVPTMFVVQHAPAHPTCKVTVACATSTSAEKAYLNAIREVASSRAALAAARDIPADVADFHDLVHGAAYYGRSGELADFRFLLDGKSTMSLELVGGLSSTQASAENLRWLLDRLAAKGMEAIAIDLTTDELRAVGLWVIRVVIPQLMPISFIHRARYLGTPRLYAEWRKRNPLAGEDFIHPGPLPFA
jgi:ribosomal protein S12 methylthiotransferase accessory factor